MIEDPSQTTATANDLTTGEMYKLRMIAINAVDRSLVSEILTTYAAKVPDAPATPTSSFADETSMTIDWIAPYNGGSPITKYII